MNPTDLRRLLADPATRVARYETLIPEYYAHVTKTYRLAWGDSFHFAIFSGSQTLRQAMAATERMIADDGGFRPGMRVLDIGCGVGGPALTIADYSGAQVTGINIVEDHVKIARRLAEKRGLGDRVRFEVADAMNMPFPDGLFDAAYVFEAGCYMPDKARFYREVARVLRPGGVFVGMDWLRRDGMTAEDQARYIEPICHCFAVPHLISLSELESHLTAAGLAVDLLIDASTRGSLEPNWKLLDREVGRSIRRVGLRFMPPVLRMLGEGGAAIAEAARAGMFLIGLWRAYKPGA